MNALSVVARRSSAMAWLVLMAVVTVTVVAAMATSAAATTSGPSTPVQASECAGPVGATRVDCGDGTSPSVPVGESAGGLGSIRDRIAGAVLVAVARWVVNGARWVLEQLFDMLMSFAAPDLGAEWFLRHLARIGRISLHCMALVYLAAAIHAAVRARGDVLLRAFAVTPVAVAGSGVAVFVLQLLTAAFDESADWLLSAASGDLAVFVVRTSVALVRLDGQAATFIGLLAGLALALSALVVWAELLMRSIALYLAASFAPLAVAGAVWPATAHWLSGLARLAVALAAWKLVIASAITVGAAMVAYGPSENGIATVLTGVGTLLLAACAPFVVLRIAHVFDADSAAGLQGGLRSATGRMLSPVMAAAGVAMAAHRMYGGGGSGGDKTAQKPDGGAQGANTPPQPPPPRVALPAGPVRRTLPPGGAAPVGLPAGHVDPPDGFVVSPGGTVEPSLPDPPSATVPGGWWIVGQDGPLPGRHPGSLPPSSSQPHR
jgi:hypothetical protein